MLDPVAVVVEKDRVVRVDADTLDAVAVEIEGEWIAARKPAKRRAEHVSDEAADVVERLAEHRTQVAVAKESEQSDECEGEQRCRKRCQTEERAQESGKSRAQVCTNSATERTADCIADSPPVAGLHCVRERRANLRRVDDLSASGCHRSPGALFRRLGEIAPERYLGRVTLLLEVQQRCHPGSPLLLNERSVGMRPVLENIQQALLIAIELVHREIRERTRFVRLDLCALLENLGGSADRIRQSRPELRREVPLLLLDVFQLPNRRCASRSHLNHLLMIP